MAKYQDGKQVPDPTPVAVPVKFRNNRSEFQRTKDMFLQLLSSHAAETERETFEEANDFDVDDDEPLPVAGAEIAGMDEEPFVRELTADADRDIIDSGEQRKESRRGEGSRRSGSEGRRKEQRRTRSDDGERGGDNDERSGTGYRERSSSSRQGDESGDSGDSVESDARHGEREDED